MKEPSISEFIKELNISYEIFYGDSKNKIEAINANLDNQDFDILILIADDMIPIINNYDEIIVDLFQKSENYLDSTIHFYTARWAHELDIWNIMGKTYYNRFNYIYHPSYQSIFSDNEYTEVSKILNKRITSEISPFVHDWIVGDETEAKNWAYNNDDWRTYEYRKTINFDLNL
jgi:hypothetical protein